ncbi:endonuclease YncB(thermonuclease family) [Saccharothrix coeruleofusca]|uniref:excalibur calcium-binding domain-containing protein n=1 Tax=Saccharothrix coeruleofusca TaxID=33919 RepID=UPI001FD2940D|nr:excalibur calcium-binding domain-containing protein [Saccharothrix coeruleofusca]MBP2340348.1 endonuclease YncB(thermonuclease family) [Saccharothrix coeruleofusca]
MAPLLAIPVLLLTSCGTGPSTNDSAALSIAPSTTTSTTTTTTTTTTPPPVQVADVVDARTIVVTGGATVQLAGLAQPGACWGQSATGAVKNSLAGKYLRVNGGTVLLPDGTDLAVFLVGQGLARAEQAAGAVLSAAQATAQQAKLGLWGAPCDGADTVAPPPPAPKPAPVPAPEPAPKPAPQPEPAPEVYYRNCDAARAAGAAPLHRGEPGYRAPLDRDNDGVACE